MPFSWNMSVRRQFINVIIVKQGEMKNKTTIINLHFCGTVLPQDSDTFRNNRLENNLPNANYFNCVTIEQQDALTKKKNTDQSNK